MKNLLSGILLASLLGLTGCADQAPGNESVLEDDDAERGSDLDTAEARRRRDAGGIFGRPRVDAGVGQPPATGTPAGERGTLPAIADPASAGPYTPVLTKKLGPNSKYVTIAPKELGRDGVKHPILIWGPGAGAYPAIYQTLLNHVASHGFFIVSYNTTPQGPELTAALDWIIAESARPDSPYFGKLDPGRIAMGGQSAGSLATFRAAKDERLRTTLHINGGTFAPHKETVNLIKPALFVCGDAPPQGTGANSLSATVDIARPNCEIDFENAKVPVWFGGVNGSGHTTVIDNPLSAKKAADNPLMKHYLAATAAWLRWQVADDAEMKRMFVGPDCGFCTAAWTVKQKGL